MGISGLGSRGGKIIGYFKSGKPIYDSAKRAIGGVARGVKNINTEAVGHRILGFSGSGVVGAYVAAPVAEIASDAYSRSAWKGLGERLDKEMKGGEQVDSKATIKGLAKYKNITVITDTKELVADKGLSEGEKYWMRKKKGLYSEVEETEKGNNAAAYRSESGKEYIFASKKVNKQVLGHEIGHIQDYRDHGGILPSNNSYMDVLKGKQYDTETRGWDKSPFKGPNDKQLKEDALKTYQISRDSKRIATSIFTGGVVTAGTIGAILARKALKLG